MGVAITRHPLGPVVWVVVEVTVVGVKQSHRGDRTPCWIFYLDSNGVGGNDSQFGDSSFEPADSACILHASSLFGTTPVPLLLFFSLYFSSKLRGRS